MSKLQRTGGLANWSIQRPIAVIMLSLTVLVIGLFSFDRLNINLLPDIIYPNVNIRILEPGTPAKVMEDKFTRQLEEQLAITEDAIRVQSDTSEGRSAVNLIFPYGTDIDRALQDASTRLDRAKRFLPQTAEPAVIYKRDPSQLPVMELIVSSSTRSSVELRSWVDYEFSKWFLNIEGVASTEVGGGLVREIQVIIDQEKLAAAGYKIADIKQLLQNENQDISSGVLYMDTHKLSARTEGRFDSIETISNLPLNTSPLNSSEKNLILSDIAQIIDAHQDEELRIRLNQQPGIKLTIQKQPDTNTIDVADRLHQQIEWFKTQNLLPSDIQIETVDDQSVYVKHALNNASYAAISGALLAMLVVYLFLRDIRRTLIVATAIPLAIFITFLIMSLNDISLNIMSLGGLALGIGLLVDNTIVMLENISRHQMLGKTPDIAASNAAAEVTSAITASTTTNLVAVLPFLFIGGLIGLLFSELIITLSAAIIASLVVALTLIPALGAKIQAPVDQKKNTFFDTLKQNYKKVLTFLLPHSLLIFSLFSIVLILSSMQLLDAKNSFFPTMDEGKVSISISTEPGTRLSELDKTLQIIEKLVLQQPEVSTAFVSSGGFVFGRSQFQKSNRGSISVQLKPLSKRNNISSSNWVKKTNKKIKKLQLAGYKVRMRVKGVRGIHTSHGDDDFSLRIQGSEIEVLTEIAETIIEKIRLIPELKNLSHSYEEQSNELVIKVKRQRAADLNISTEDIGTALQLALNGQVATEYIEGDREYDIRLRLQRSEIKQLHDINNIIISLQQGEAIRLFDVADISISPAPSIIKRDNQLRINEISASVNSDVDYQQLIERVFDIVNEMPIPDGYIVYDGGTLDTLKESSSTSYILLALAVFLVFVVMTVQYESLTNPVIIILGVPFTLIGVYLAVEFALDGRLSMPARLGIIMLAGIVVNNAIVLVEQIEICRQQGMEKVNAVLEAAMLRLRPILMTSLTSVFGMLPLALGLSEGSEMLKPLATVVVFGLSFSLLVSLILIPMLYLLVHKKESLT
ncbi:MAG: AcrB/AcrD/AcrF family protein [endosymbiont of Galathealinum brachiosum]|uniref:AcrB/AcrD/AcrF family protein n=1 Tax=endosymbiont of Galathealinum brachiosum TaxID=2200906 RepID=A0A370DJ50_9GAMM|nr:MAG: AcrB/AcrD/AcrF family protein [endosymbiont of Galathealinum brachiosum]